MKKMEEDIYSVDSEKKRVLSTFKNRVGLWNYAEKLLNRKYVSRTVNDTGIDTNNVDEMIKFIMQNNKRIDEIREALVQRRKVSELPSSC